MLRWGLVELLVEALGGDVEQLHQLRLAATHEQARAWEGLARADSPGVSGHGDQARALVAELGLPEAGQDASLA